MCWPTLVAVAIMYVCGCCLTYHKELHDRWWYYPVAITLGAAVNWLWFWATRGAEDSRRVYVFSLFWDAIMVFVYYGLPLVMFGVRLDRWSIFGAGLIVAGLTIVKLAHP